MHTIHLREATRQDLPSILSLYSAAGIGDTNFTTEEADAHFSRLQRYPYFRIFVARIDAVVVGTYELLIMDNLAKRGARSAVVEDVAVHPNFQGCGVGRAMMDHAREQCRQQQCYKLTLSSNLNREEAHRFYEALGFEKHGYSFRITP